jgi:hypothetical protein
MSTITITLDSADYQDHETLADVEAAVAAEHGLSHHVEAKWGDEQRDTIRVSVYGLTATHYLVSDDGPEGERISVGIEAADDKAAMKLAAAVDAAAAYDEGRCDAEDDAEVEGLTAALEALSARRVSEVARGWSLYALPR